jgi:hypothetical protein
MVRIHIPVLEEFNLPPPAGINYRAQTVALAMFFLFPKRLRSVHWK